MAIDTLGANALASDSVTTVKIANDAVTAAKIPAGAVVADIADGGITTAKLADDAITGAKLANDIAISTTGNIATTGSGTITSAGLITASGSVAVGGTGAANTLDDYEEGTWTPTASTNAGTLSTAGIGVYTKIGRLVLISGYVVFTGASTSANRVYGGLPFTVQDWNGSSSVDFFGNSWGNHGGMVYWQGGTTNFNDNYSRVGSGSFTASGNTRFEGFYFTD